MFRSELTSREQDRIKRLLSKTFPHIPFRPYKTSMGQKGSNTRKGVDYWNKRNQDLWENL